MWREDGQDLVEYALVVGLVAFAAVALMQPLTAGINEAFEELQKEVNSNAPQPKTPTRPSASSNEYAETDKLEAWKRGLKSGSIEYRVPKQMLAHYQSAVTVHIHGYKDTKGAHPMAGATEQDRLKVASHMKVELLAPLNVSEFNIVPQDSDPVKLVPNDGYQTWTWIVTPTTKANDQVLEIDTSLVYEGKHPKSQIVKDKEYTVNVEVQDLSKTISQAFWKDPLAWFKYALPGGKGWAAIAALFSSLGLGGFAFWKHGSKKKNRRTGAKSRKADAEPQVADSEPEENDSEPKG